MSAGQPNILVRVCVGACGQAWVRACVCVGACGRAGVGACVCVCTGHYYTEVHVVLSNHSYYCLRGIV